MEVCNSPDIFQENIYEIFEVFDVVHVYIDDVLVITGHNVVDHLKALEKVLQKLVELVLKVKVKGVIIWTHIN